MLAAPPVLITAVSLRDTVMQAADFASESHVKIYLYFYSWDAPKTLVFDTPANHLDSCCQKPLPEPK
jgi:hypothetical protein